MEQINFNNLPQAVQELKDDLAIVKRLLLEKSNEPQPDQDELLTVPDAAYPPDQLHLPDLLMIFY